MNLVVNARLYRVSRVELTGSTTTGGGFLRMPWTGTAVNEGPVAGKALGSGILPGILNKLGGVAVSETFIWGRGISST